MRKRFYLATVYVAPPSNFGLCIFDLRQFRRLKKRYAARVVFMRGRAYQKRTVRESIPFKDKP